MLAPVGLGILINTFAPGLSKVVGKVTPLRKSALLQSSFVALDHISPPPYLKLITTAAVSTLVALDDFPPHHIWISSLLLPSLSHSTLITFFDRQI